MAKATAEAVLTHLNTTVHSDGSFDIHVPAEVHDVAGVESKSGKSDVLVKFPNGQVGEIRFQVNAYRVRR